MSSRIPLLLLRMYPREFQESAGAEALLLIRDRWHDERGLVRRVRLCLDLAADLVVTRVRARSEPQAVPSSANRGALFGWAARDTSSGATVLPGMLLSLLMVLVFVRLITPDGDRHLTALLQALPTLPLQLLDAWRP